MMGTAKREAAAGLLYWSGVGALCRAWQRTAGSRERLTILAYHRVDEPGSSLGFLDEELISATPAQFEEQVSYLVWHYHLTTFGQLQKLRQQGRELPPLSLVITFDDGFRDMAEVAWPILRKYHVPAVVFLATDYITSGELFWWDKVYYCLKQTPRRQLSLGSHPGLGPLSLTTDEERRQAKTKLIQYLKQVPDKVRQQILEELAAEAEVKVEPPPGWRATLTWEEVRQLHQAGLEFGAHTMSHPILTQCSDEVLISELGGSRQKIEGETGQPCVSFCYPGGMEGAYNKRVRDAVAACGYKFATIAQHGVNYLAQADLLALRRLRVTPQDSLVVFKQKLLFPHWIKY